VRHRAWPVSHPDHCEQFPNMSGARRASVLLAVGGHELDVSSACHEWRHWLLGQGG